MTDLRREEVPEEAFRTDSVSISDSRVEGLILFLEEAFAGDASLVLPFDREGPRTLIPAGVLDFGAVELKEKVGGVKVQRVATNRIWYRIFVRWLTVDFIRGKRKAAGMICSNLY